MGTLDQIRHGFQHAVDSVAEGWRTLREGASQALTRFTPRHPEGASDTASEQVVRNASRWGLLAAEVKEEKDSVCVRLEAPGMEADEFDIQVVDDYLVVRGEKHVEREQESGRYYLLERAYGAFERAIALPAPVDESGAKARYRRGVLSITLPKSQQAHARRIEVKSA